MKAYRVIKDNESMAIIKAKSSGAAKQAYIANAKLAGYVFRFTEIKVTRASIYDDYDIPPNRAISPEFVWNYKPEGAGID